MTFLEMQDIFHIFSEKLKIFLRGAGKTKKPCFLRNICVFWTNRQFNEALNLDSSEFFLF